MVVGVRGKIVTSWLIVMLSSGDCARCAVIVYDDVVYEPEKKVYTVGEYLVIAYAFSKIKCSVMGLLLTINIYIFIDYFNYIKVLLVAKHNN